MSKSMKYIIAIFIVILFLIGSWFLFNDSKKENKEPQIIDGIRMYIKEGTLTKSGATIIIIDRTLDEKHTYGESFRIEKKENNKWTKLDTILKDYGFNAIGYHVDENKKLEMEVNWKWLYGNLKKGEYRLIKDFAINKKDSYLGSKEIFVEFTIDESNV